MFKQKIVTDLESRLKSFSHCWLKFSISGDDYAVKTNDFIFNAKDFDISVEKMAKCRQFTIDEFGSKKWFSVYHYDSYLFQGFDMVEMKKILLKTNPPKDSVTLIFKMQNGDEFTFTSDPKLQKEIDDLINKTS